MSPEPSGPCSCAHEALIAKTSPEWYGMTATRSLGVNCSAASLSAAAAAAAAASGAFVDVTEMPASSGGVAVSVP